MMGAATTLLSYCALLILVLSLSNASVVYQILGRRGEEIRSPEEAELRRVRRQLEPNETIVDDHIYYTSAYYGAGSEEANHLWVDLGSLLDQGAAEDHFSEESDLSGLHRYIEFHDLKFKFPFYGHILQSVGVTTGGFLYTGDPINEDVAKQFIGPLLADFNPNITETGRILFLSTEERFTVQWDMVHNHDHFNDGPFTFQVSIFPSGIIYFVYKQIPLLVSDIDNEGHPVEVGLADAYYYIERIIGNWYSLRVFLYHSVSLDSSQNLTNSAYVLTPLPNCVTATTCQECADTTLTSEFQCGWCEQLNRCSDGFDRNRQEWVGSGCHTEQQTTCKPLLTTISSSTTAPSSSPTLPTTTTNQPRPRSGEQQQQQQSLSTSARAGIAVAVIAVVIVILLILIGGTIFLIAYRNPNSKMGQFIIKHRPKARSLNRTTESSSATYKVTTDKARLEMD